MDKFEFTIPWTAISTPHQRLGHCRTELRALNVLISMLTCKDDIKKYRRQREALLAEMSKLEAETLSTSNNIDGVP